MSNHHNEYTEPGRFEVVTTYNTWTDPLIMKTINVCEMGGEKWIDQLGYAKRVLFKSVPTDLTSEAGRNLYTTAERVVDALNHMNLGLQAAEAADPENGLQRLFDYLWKLELDE